MILISLIGIGAIIYRKKPYFLKLASLNQSSAGANGYMEVSQKTGFSWREYFIEFFPEFKAFIGSLKMENYRTLWLSEAEKLLRRTRVISLKVDRLSDSLIGKIRRISSGLRFKHEEIKMRDAFEEGVRVVSDDETKKPGEQTAASPSLSPNFLKNEEERLIIEIAKNPKDSSLYEALGDLYMEMANFADAKESYGAAIELSPQEESLKQKLSSALLGLTRQK